MNKEQIVDDVIQILSTSDYIDPSENLYDGLKLIKREITYATVHDFLWSMNANVIDVDGKVRECINKIRPLMNHLSRERYNQIIDEAYKNYRSKSKDLDLPENLYNKLIDDLNKDAMFPIDNPSRMLLKQDFINKCKTDQEFSERWGLRIEERELSLEERKRIYETEYVNGIEVENNHWLESKLKTRNIPTKLITITYNNTKTEIYE